MHYPARLTRLVLCSRSGVCVRLVCLVTCALACSCQSGLRETGIHIGDKTLEHFKKGQTTEEWLIAVIGQPTSTSVVPTQDHVRILRYTTIDKSTGIFDFLGGSSSRTTATIHFVVTDKIVTDFWADRDTTSFLLGETEKKSGEKAK
jgi:hypothetical protein